MWSCLTKLSDCCAQVLIETRPPLRRRPLAQAGFGLPEIFLLFEERLARRVPQDESEARLIQEFYREKGPFARAATERALERVFSRLGSGRPLATYLQALSTLIVPRGS